MTFLIWTDGFIIFHCKRPLDATVLIAEADPDLQMGRGGGGGGGHPDPEIRGGAGLPKIFLGHSGLILVKK